MLRPFILRGKQKGQALTEFILVVPVLLLIIFGIMQLAIIGNAYIVVHHAAYTAARVAAVHSGGGRVRESAQEICRAVTKDISRVTTTTTKTGDDVKVKVTYRMSLIFPIINLILGENRQLSVSAVAQMRIE